MVLILCSALATTRGLAWKAIPRPVSDIIGKSLAPSPVPTKILLGEGLGAGGKPEIGRSEAEKNIDDILNMSVAEAIEFFSPGPEQEAKDIALKLQPLVDVGLEYLKLAQSSSTLSGGESQRIKLAYFLAMSRERSGRDKILFIFDEPTTGLHFSDVERLLKAFDALLERGHSVLVVEHNTDVIKAADWVIDLGPDAGDRGGEVVFAGTPEDLAKTDTFTAKYIK